MLPSGDRIKEKAGEWVYECARNDFRIMLNSVYTYINPPHSLPFSGGYLDQPIWFIEAIRCFKHGETLYGQQNKTTGDVLKSLGAKKK